MKKFLLAAATLAASATAQAAPVFIVDDFLSSPNPTSLSVNGMGDTDTTGNQSYSLGGFGYSRNILLEIMQDASPAGSGGTLMTGDADSPGDGQLSISNGTGVKTRSTLTYDVSSLYQDLSSTTSAAFAVIFSDGVVANNPDTPENEAASSTSIEAILNGTQIGLWTLTCPIQTSEESCDPEFAGFNFNGLLLTGVNDILQFVINGPAGYDLGVDQIAVEVPEPAMVALFGLGLMGLGIGRRRKAA